MTLESSITIGKYQHYGWIRCSGKGSFSISSVLKSAAEMMLHAKIQSLVIDLSDCSGMDSTFMGTMASIACRIQKCPEGKLIVGFASEKNTHSLQDLGLDFMLEINTHDDEWQPHQQSIHESLEPYQEGKINCHFEHAQNSLDAHQSLCDINSKNDSRFSAVLDTLQKKVASQSQAEQ